MEAIPVTAENSSSANPSNASVKSDGSSMAESGRDSPPPNCAICLGRCRNKSFTDSCLHQFCFKCLVTWSRVKTECPLCKQNFKSIIHNVKSNHQYEEYPVEQRHEEDIERIVAATRRATLTMPRNDSLVFQQMLLQYPISAIMRQGLSLTSALEGSGILAPRQRRRSSPTSFRRTVYRHNLWARPLPDFTGRYRECTPEFYRYNDSQVHRLIPWLNRELHYLLNENAGHIAYVLARIMELLPQHHIVSDEFRDALQRYFRERTTHFTHELYVFASTPYDLTGYDRNVQYGSDTRLSTTVNEVPSGSESDGSVDSDIVMVSSSHADEPRAGPSRAPAGPSRALAGRSRAPAGPSRAPANAPSGYPLGSGYMPHADNNVIPIETISHSDTDDSSSEVMVVGYIKPPRQRTPEIVDLLGSDSDVLVQDAPADPPPAPTRPTAATQSTQPTAACSQPAAAPSRPTAGPSRPAAAPSRLAAATTAPTPTVNLVRLKLTQHRPPVGAADSDSDESYTPPQPAPPLAGRSRRRTRPSATTSDTDHGTSTSSSPSSSIGSLSSSRSTLTSSVDSSSSSSSYSPRRRAPPAKRKRKTDSGDATSNRAQNNTTSNTAQKKKNKKRLKLSSKTEKMRVSEGRRAGAALKGCAKCKPKTGRDVKSTRRPVAAERVLEDSPGPSAAPSKSAPSRPAPSRAAPPSAAPPRAAPPSAAPSRAAPPSAVPPRAAPSKSAPPSAAPSRAAPPSAVPPRASPSKSAPPSAAPPNAAPSRAAPPSAAPPSAAPSRAAPPSAAPPSAAPSRPAPPSAAPPSAAPSRAAPPCAAPSRAAPLIAAPPSTAPPSTAPPSAAPSRSAPSRYALPSAASPSSASPSAASPRAAPSSAAPSRAAPPSTTPSSTSPSTASPSSASTLSAVPSSVSPSKYAPPSAPTKIRRKIRPRLPNPVCREIVRLRSVVKAMPQRMQDCFTDSDDPLNMTNPADCPNCKWLPQ